MSLTKCNVSERKNENDLFLTGNEFIRAKQVAGSSKHRKVINRYFSIDGCDTSGTTSTVDVIKKKLVEKGYKVLTQKQPDYNRDIIKAKLKMNNTPETNAEIIDLFIEDRVVSQRKTQEFLKENPKGIVLCDREIHSTFVYQCYPDNKFDRELYKSIIRKSFKENSIKFPLSTFILTYKDFEKNIPIIKERLSDRSSKDVFDKIENIKIINERYEKLATFYSQYPDEEHSSHDIDCTTYAIDCTKSLDEISDEIVENIIELCKYDDIADISHMGF